MSLGGACRESRQGRLQAVGAFIDDQGYANSVHCVLSDAPVEHESVVRLFMPALIMCCSSRNMPPASRALLFYKRCLPLSSGAACAGEAGGDFLYLCAQIF